MTFYSLVYHVCFRRRTKHLVYCQVERTYAISLFECKTVIACCFSNNVHRRTFAVGNALYTRADDYVTTLKAKYEAQTDADIEAAAKQIIQPDALTWVIVGDLKKIEQPLRALKLGEVSVLDADGKTVP